MLDKLISSVRVLLQYNRQKEDCRRWQCRPAVKASRPSNAGSDRAISEAEKSGRRHISGHISRIYACRKRLARHSNGLTREPALNLPRPNSLFAHRKLGRPSAPARSECIQSSMDLPPAYSLNSCSTAGIAPSSPPSRPTRSLLVFPTGRTKRKNTLHSSSMHPRAVPRLRPDIPPFS
jgi:hypothetical protein